MGRSDSSPPRRTSLDSVATGCIGASSFAPRGADARAAPRARFGSPRNRRGGSGQIEKRPPRFLGNPLVHALVDDPGEITDPTTRPVDVAFRDYQRVGSRDFELSGLHCRAWVLPVYASPRRSPDAAQHSVLDGGQPCPGGTLTRGVALRISTVLRQFSSSPGFAWRTIVFPKPVRESTLRRRSLGAALVERPSGTRAVRTEDHGRRFSAFRRSTPSPP